MIERVPLTASGRLHLEEEAEKLVVRIEELRELLEDAHADRTADDDERAAALALLDEHSRLEARLAEVRVIIESSIDAPPVPTDVAALGTRVRVREEDGAIEMYDLVSPAEASPSDGRVSINSPLGQALAGRKPGEKATVVAPSGSWQVELLAIEAMS